MLRWSTLMSDNRVWDDLCLHQSTAQSDRTSFQADYDRIIYSESFRRLARKTQVHPLVPNDLIRNRLTHSLEVAGVGRSFGTRTWRLLFAKHEDVGNASEDDFRYVLQAACLAHDIGNPPFGHAGEFAIRTWAKENSDFLFGAGQEFEVVDEGVRSDWLNFEGNAQGFRLASRADNARFAYMNLTSSTLATMVKYPWGSLDERVLKANENKRKFNYFSTEQVHFDIIFKSLGLEKDGQYARHPLSFLSEAADDLCYRIADVEDAVKMGILESKRVRDIFLSICGCSESKAEIGKLRASAIGCLIDAFWQVFEDNYNHIMNGTRTDDLKSGLDSKYTDALSEVSSCYESIFAHRFKVATELGAFRCLGEVIKPISCAAQSLCALKLWTDPAVAASKYHELLDFRSKRCFELTFGEEYVKANITEQYPWWLHQILDFVSGMTDNFAQQLCKEISGYSGK